MGRIGSYGEITSPQGTDRMYAEQNGNSMYVLLQTLGRFFGHSGTVSASQEVLTYEATGGADISVGEIYLNGSTFASTTSIVVSSEDKNELDGRGLINLLSNGDIFMVSKPGTDKHYYIYRVNGDIDTFEVGDPADEIEYTIPVASAVTQPYGSETIGDGENLSFAVLSFGQEEATPIIVEDEGSSVTTELGTLNFTGNGVTATADNGDVTVNITSGSSSHPTDQANARVTYTRDHEFTGNTITFDVTFHVNSGYTLEINSFDADGSGFTSQGTGNTTRTLTIPNTFKGTDSVSYNVTSTHTVDGTTNVQDLTVTVEVFEPWYAGDFVEDPEAVVPLNSSELSDQGKISNGTTYTFTPGLDGTVEYLAFVIPTSFSSDPTFSVQGEVVVPDPYDGPTDYKTYIFPIKRKRTILINS